LRSRRGRAEARAHITQATGRLDPRSGSATFVVVVGPAFDQQVPNAIVLILLGYCRAFETLGIPYLIVDIADVAAALPELPRPFCLIDGHDVHHPWVPGEALRALRRHPSCVWATPWFRDSDRFFASHDLDASVWDWAHEHRRRVLACEPRFVFTGTAPRGLGFFEEWHRNGVPAVSMPFACDTTLYTPDAPHRGEFDGVEMAFVGGYWPSKGRQIDAYLRPLEDNLVIYGYSEWPYRGYRGQLAPEREPSLYRQARLSPTINEPSVALLHGQINERVFKILGCGGVTVVDAVPAYRDFFSDDELPIADDPDDFRDRAHELLRGEPARERWRERGFKAVMERHTYVHRARELLARLGVNVGPTVRTHRETA
jgi:hypothetical protein